MFFIAQLVFTTILIAVQWYLYRRAAREAGGASPWIRHLSAALLLAGTIPLLLLLFFRPALRDLPRWTIDSLIVPFYLWQFTCLLFFLCLVGIRTVVFLVRVSLRVLRSSHEHSPLPADPLAPRRIFMRQGAAALAGTILLGSTYGSLRRDRYERTDLHVPISKLPAAFEGYRIGFLSDIHSSVFMTKEQMRRYVDAVNSMGCDLIVVGGDFVNSLVEEVYPFAEAFSELRAPDGVFGVLGNHDFYTRQVETVAREVNQCGITLLRSSAIPILRGASSLVLGGVDDVGTATRAGRMFDAAFADAPAGSPMVLMCHRPYFFPQAADRYIDLVLSGHTHGGQIVFGSLRNGVIAPARMVSEYVAGLYTIGRSQMYVSRGIGTVGVPIRFNCPPEITSFTLVNA